ncbi:hypothetical protein GQ57_33945 [Burkholderia sp. MSh2]|uniref:Flagellar FliJ protein n=1 Tax=Burkholderia paludis TaxID=1506587 RepID=A0A6J5E0D7_9BURK|nr:MULTISPECIES: hypothetical protein [Burkholderia]KEZ01648.1 hypothetical protein GQ57_33945 [Burkholderia sp. MSh2]CAB3759900.1 hypothetical protein LMG30113_03555 [Burkholderia paludis]VWC43678.1 hypothetical protein BPA30113_07120 [Burkholderia paludis]
MSVDLRGFRYRLEPARRLADWRLAAAIARLGEVQRALDEVTRQIGDLDAACETQAQRLASRMVAGCDPSGYASGLAWIAGLHRERNAAWAVKDEWLERRRGVRSELAMLQARVDAFGAHRDVCETAYASEEALREAAEADKDWLARTAMRARNLARGGSYGK